MKRIQTTILILITVCTSTLAQTRVKASDIIRQINEGKTVEYTNAEIEGDLDLTDLDNRRRERSSVNFFTDNDTYESQVEVSLKFTNCTFLGNVLAYYHIERRNDTYIAHFEKDAIFRDCKFKESSEFKYSEFNGVAVFSGTTFNREANFKYAEFSAGPSFNNARFESGADFKYTEFPAETSFERATFYELANFKYAKFKSPARLDGIAFKGDEDFKYTKMDGRSFTSYLLHR